MDPVLIQAICEGRLYIEEPHPWNGAVVSLKGRCAAQNVLLKCAPQGVLTLCLPLSGCLLPGPTGAREFCISFLAPTRLLQRSSGSCSRGLAPEKKPSQR